MNDRALFDGCVLAVIALVPVTWIALTRIAAPYGRHLRAGWGPRISSTAGWMLMEAPAVLSFAAVYAMGDHRASAVPVALMVAWQLHYLHRALVFPLRRKRGARPMPVVIVAMGFTFNLVNAYINARWISHFGSYVDAWAADPRMFGGLILFVGGLAINVWSDQILMALRAHGRTDYRIPCGGLFRWVSAPNYLGEILEWCGWALATWSLPGLAFALYSAANLVPRAVSNHRWYQREFPDYPQERKAIVPYLY